jgi:arabinan endo-1,5-alpha-L-arabinosidase
VIRAALLGALLAGCASQPATHPEMERLRYVNPVLNRDFPDPAVLRAIDGDFYAYATQSQVSERMLNIPVARSRDLVSWQLVGDALPAKPAWAAGKQKFWAPHVIRDPVQKRYFMYYSAEPDDASGKCLAVAIADQPAGPFVDWGRPLICGEGIEHIDPMAFDDPQSGKRLLYWGSGRSPIKVQELTVDRTAFLPGSVAKEILFPDPGKPYSALVEGAWVIFRHGTYYLFYSGDRCCVADPRYAVMVARSTNPFGPFELFAQSEQSASSAILERSGRWVAPGHNSVVTDDDGTDWLLYHAVDAERTENGRVMLLDPLVYREGWPRVKGGQPSNVNQVAPARKPIAAVPGNHDKLAQ